MIREKYLCFCVLSILIVIPPFCSGQFVPLLYTSVRLIVSEGIPSNEHVQPTSLLLMSFVLFCFVYACFTCLLMTIELNCDDVLYCLVWVIEQVFHVSMYLQKLRISSFRSSYDLVCRRTQSWRR